MIDGVANSEDKIRVLLVDDQELFRRGISMVLGLEPDIDIVEATDGDDALAKVAAAPPDVALLDVRMPGLSGVELCAAVRAESPSTGVIMLTSSEEESDLYSSIKNGASGYLLKDSSIEQLGEAIRLVAGGQSLISPAMATKLLEEFVEISKPKDEKPTLTPREMEVLRQVARGLSNHEIGEELFISENTVKNHIRNILEKLQMKSRLEAVMYAVRSKMLDLP
ncbi:MAG: response regulator transcription factor [Propionibacteriales bacterium]|nr:response regulator transcription factor [Propionibacteriales bacterium]